MKRILALVAATLFAVSAFADERAAKIERYRAVMQKELDARGVKDTVRAEDTGENVDLGDGNGPLIILKLPKLGRECLIALHPTNEDLSATLGCDDVAPKTSI